MEKQKTQIKKRTGERSTAGKGSREARDLRGERKRRCLHATREHGPLLVKLLQLQRRGIKGNRQAKRAPEVRSKSETARGDRGWLYMHTRTFSCQSTDCSTAGRAEIGLFPKKFTYSFSRARKYGVRVIARARVCVCVCASERRRERGWSR